MTVKPMAKKEAKPKVRAKPKAKTARQKKAEEVVKAQAAERRLVALNLRKRRYSYREIGEQLGVTHETARRDVKTALAEVQKNTKESAEELILLEREWLDLCRQALLEKIGYGDVPAINAARQLSESQRSLLGLDAPMKFAPTTPDGKEEAGVSNLEAALEKIAARLSPGTEPSGESGGSSEPVE